MRSDGGCHGDLSVNAWSRRKWATHWYNVAPGFSSPRGRCWFFRTHAPVVHDPTCDGAWFLEPSSRPIRRTQFGRAVSRSNLVRWSLHPGLKTTQAMMLLSVVDCEVRIKIVRTIVFLRVMPITPWGALSPDYEWRLSSTASAFCRREERTSFGLCSAMHIFICQFKPTASHPRQ